MTDLAPTVYTKPRRHHPSESRVPCPEGRFTLIGILVLVGFILLASRLVQLHLFPYDLLANDAAAPVTDTHRLEARRGNVVDRNGKPLALTRTLVEVGVDPERVNPGKRENWAEAATILGLTEEAFATTLTNRDVNKKGVPVQWRELHDSLPEEDFVRLQELGIRGLYGYRRYSRIYPAENSASHILGFVNREGQPAGGVEAVYDFYLRGRDGWRELERDGKRREVVRFRRRDVSPENGYHVQLSIDLTIQAAAEAELASMVESTGMKAGSILVSDPRTGFILACASFPDFDPNRYNEFPLENHRNRAITDIFEPGSTFKIVSIGAALNEGAVAPEDFFDCSLAVAPYRNRMVTLPKDHHPMGQLSLLEIMTRSSNRGAALVGMELGEERLYSYVRRYGFVEPTGVGLPGEAIGMLAPIRRWDGLTISRLPMGHAIGVTPMQMHNAMCAVANNGLLMNPRIVERVIDDNENVIYAFEPRERRRVLRAEVAEQVTGMLLHTASPNGTARSAYLPGYAVAAKTGTSQKIIDGAYSTQHHIASISGFFPAHDPQFAITVVLDDPDIPGVAYGGAVAGPVFKRIAEQIIPYAGLEPGDASSLALAWEMPLP